MQSLPCLWQAGPAAVVVQLFTCLLKQNYNFWTSRIACLILQSLKHTALYGNRGSCTCRFSFVVDSLRVSCGR